MLRATGRDASLTMRICHRQHRRCGPAPPECTSGSVHTARVYFALLLTVASHDSSPDHLYSPDCIGADCAHSHNMLVKLKRVCARFARVWPCACGHTLCAPNVPATSPSLTRSGTQCPKVQVTHQGTVARSEKGCLNEKREAVEWRPHRRVEAAESGRGSTQAGRGLFESDAWATELDRRWVQLETQSTPSGIRPTSPDRRSTDPSSHFACDLAMTWRCCCERGARCL